MIVLGVSESRTDAAAAVALDGRLISAAGEAELLAGSFARPSRQTNGLYAGGSGGTTPELAIRFGLSQSGPAASELSAIALVDEERWADDEVREGTRGREGARALSVSAGHAAAALAAAALPADAGAASAAHATARALVIGGSADAGAIFTVKDGALRLDRGLRGAGHLLGAASATAGVLGLPVGDQALDALSELGALGALGASAVAGSSADDGGDELQQALRWDDGEVRYDEGALRAFVERAQAGAPGPLARADHPHLDVQRARRFVASSFIANLASLVAAIAKDTGERGAANGSIGGSGVDANPAATLAFGGPLFSSPRFNSHLAQLLGGAVTFSPVPEGCGLALGAALAASSALGASAFSAAAGAGNGSGPLAHLSLGPSFSEDDVKATLENCRIDFVYEPSWLRLLTRTSQLLSRGKVIAWFQGPLDFGPRSLGSRGILCDPSNRYARHNINEYLLGRSVEAPLAVSLLADDAETHLMEGRLQSPFMLRRAQFRDSATELFRSALDGGHGCTVHTAAPIQSVELSELLTIHRQHTGVPGLIHQPLKSGLGAMAATPRAALQAFFSSAIDAMVIGRFLLMKDYWLLRSDS